MPTALYDFANPGEYTTVAVDLSTGSALLSPTVSTGTVRGDTFLKGIRLDSFVVDEEPNGGSIAYGLEIDTVLKWHNGIEWVPSNGNASQLNSAAQVQSALGTAIGTERPIVKPFARLTRGGISSPRLNSILIEYSAQVPSRQVIMADSPAVALNTGPGGVPSPGQTRVTLDPSQIMYSVGADELWVFRNGLLQPPTAYIEEDTTHVVFNTLLDAIAPGIDELEFRTALAGMSLFILPPTFLIQARPPTRPDNFGGNFQFS